MTTLGVQRRDRTGKSSRWAHIVVPMIAAPIALGCGGAGAMTALLAIPAAGTGGAVARGVRTWHDTSDPTIVERHWTRPQWLRMAGFVVVAVCAALALFYVVADPFASGYQWLVNLAVWGGSLAVLGWLAFGEKVRERRAGPTPEASALSRINATHFVQAGLAIKSPNSGLHITPELAYADHDERGNPFYVAQLLAGHQTLADWQKAGPRLASAWAVPRVEVTDEGTNRVRVTAILREFSRDAPVAWRAATPSRRVAEYIAALPMGEYARRSEPWVQDLREANLTVGGVPGSGKSVYLSALLAHLVKHPDVDVGFIDLKRGVEAAKWKGRLSAVAKTQAEAVDLIQWLKEDCDARYDEMEAQGIENAFTEGVLGPDHPLKVLVVDEAAELFSGVSRDSRKLAADAAELLRSLVSLGRAAGYIVILATQKPTVDTLPSAIRDLTTIRVSFAVRADNAAAAILGSDWYGSEGDASPLGISRQERGMAVVGDDAGEFVRVQTSLITKDDVRRIVADTAHYRREWAWTGTGTPEPAKGAEQPEPEPTRAKDGPVAMGLPDDPDDDPAPDPTQPVSTGQVHADEPPPPSVPDLRSMVYGATEDRVQGDDSDPDPEPEQPPKKTRDIGWEF